MRNAKVGSLSPLDSTVTAKLLQWLKVGLKRKMDTNEKNAALSCGFFFMAFIFVYN